MKETKEYINKERNQASGSHTAQKKYFSQIQTRTSTASLKLKAIATTKNSLQLQKHWDRLAVYMHHSKLLLNWHFSRLQGDHVRLTGRYNPVTNCMVFQSQPTAVTFTQNEQPETRAFSVKNPDSQRRFFPVCHIAIKDLTPATRLAPTTV